MIKIARYMIENNVNFECQWNVPKAVLEKLKRDNEWISTGQANRMQKDIYDKVHEHILSNSRPRSVATTSSRSEYDGNAASVIEAIAVAESSINNNVNNTTSPVIFEGTNFAGLDDQNSNEVSSFKFKFK
jgi:hypothetical protein